MMLSTFLLMLVFPFALCAVNVQTLTQVLNTDETPFNYPLNLQVFAGQNSNEDVIICCHGFGGDYSIASVIASYQVVPAHLVGFNFPDYDVFTRNLKPVQMAYGSINELLPAIYLLRKIAVDAQAETISLYGFSAGGGAVVNIIGVLNTSQYDQMLNSIGVDLNDKRKILTALQRGVILLDAPLKSMEEYNAFHPAYSKDPINMAQTQRYRANGMVPIEALAKWKGLKLSVVVFFQNPDTALSNRDDNLFAQKLQQANPEGRNVVLIKSEGGHLGFHYSLWKAYQEVRSK